MLEVSTFHAVEFSKTVAGARGVKKPPTRARGLQSFGYLGRIRLRPKALQCRVTGLFLRHPSGRPTNGSSRLGGVKRAKPHETALSGLYEGPVERLTRQVEHSRHLAVHLDPALG